MIQKLKIKFNCFNTILILQKDYWYFIIKLKILSYFFIFKFYIQNNFIQKKNIYISHKRSADNDILSIM